MVGISIKYWQTYPNIGDQNIRDIYIYIYIHQWITDIFAMGNMEIFFKVLFFFF